MLLQGGARGGATQRPGDREVVFEDQGRGFDQPPNDAAGARQHIQPHGIPSAPQFGSLTIRMRTHLWISWGRIAIKHEATAHAVRQEMLQAGADQSGLLLKEADWTSPREVDTGAMRPWLMVAG